MDHKNQHWIPRSYLKAWCDPERRDKVVHRYAPDGAYLDWRPYSRIFSADDLYTVDVEGTRDVRTEKVFKVIEDEFLRVRRAIESGNPWPAMSKQALAWFIAATRNRSPAERDHWQSFKDQIVEIGDEVEAALKRASKEERQRIARASIGGLRDPSRSMTMEEARSAAAEPFGRWVLRHTRIEAELLKKMSFAVLKAPEGVGFITSDNPVVWHDPLPCDGRLRHIGLDYRLIEVSMPISPRFCLLFDHLGQDSSCDIDQSTVDMFNDRTLRQCEKYFIANSGDLAVDWYEVGESRTDEGTSAA
jgi:hypothetical protein